jgi:hypothetical protein
VRRFLLLAAAALSGCVRPAPPADFTLKVAVVGLLAPIAHDTQSTSSTLATDLLFEPVLQPDGNGLRSRALAQWERRGRGLRALLADRLTFSDGSPVTAADVVRAISAVGLRVQSEGAWLAIEPGADGLPVEAVLLTAVLYKGSPQGDLGTGPFRLVHQDEHRIVVERRVPERRRVSRVEIISFPSIRETFARALKGEVNAVTSLDDRQVELVDGVPNLRILRTRGPHALAVHLNPRRLGPDLRRRIAEALPVEEIADIALTKGCGPPSGQWQPVPLPPGEPLDIMVSALDSSIERAGLATRRSLGPRGGEIAHLDPGQSVGARARHDLIIDNVLVWPPMLGALYWKSGGPWNWTGYANPAYDAAVDAGDLERADAELKKDPPVLQLCRRERIAAVDARLKNATLGAWGALETLPDWEVSP